MSFYAKFWGTRGSIPTPGYQTRKYGGNTSCVEIRWDDTLFVCDAGTGVRELGEDLLQRGNDDPIVAHMFFSHPHWDHIQGFPFFTPVYVPNNTFYIYGNSGGSQGFFKLLSGQMASDYFPVSFTDLGAHIQPGHTGDNGELDEEGLLIEGVRVRCFKQRHPGGSWAYAFERDGNKIVFATDNEIDLTLENADRVQDALSAHRKAPDAFLKFIEGADLLIADGQYTEAEYPQKIGWGHPRATTLVDVCLDAKVKQLAVTHHDPMQDDEAVDEKIDRCRRRAQRSQTDLVIFGAREGLELKIG